MIATCIPPIHKQSRREAANTNMAHLEGALPSIAIWDRFLQMIHFRQLVHYVRPYFVIITPPMIAVVCSTSVPRGSTFSASMLPWLLCVFHLGTIMCICFFLAFPDYEKLRSELSEILSRASHPPEAESERTVDVNSLTSAPTKAVVSAESTGLWDMLVSRYSIYMHIIINYRGTNIISRIGAIGAVAKCAMWCNCANSMGLSRNLVENWAESNMSMWFKKKAQGLLWCNGRQGPSFSRRQ